RNSAPTFISKERPHLAATPLLWRQWSWTATTTRRRPQAPPVCRDRHYHFRFGQLQHRTGGQQSNPTAASSGAPTELPLVSSQSSVSALPSAACTVRHRSQ